MKAGNRPVISSGSLVTQEGDETVDLEYQDLNFHVVFEQDGTGNLHSESKADNKTLRILLKNFNNTLGSAWFSEVGTTQGKKLFLALHISAVGTATHPIRMIAFTFSTEEM